MQLTRSEPGSLYFVVAQAPDGSTTVRTAYSYSEAKVIATLRDWTPGTVFHIAEHLTQISPE